MTPTLPAPDLPTAIRIARRGKAVKTTCPAHEDRQDSLNVMPGSDSLVTLFCHAGCEVRDILAAAGLDRSDLDAPSDTVTVSVQADRVTIVVRRAES